MRPRNRALDTHRAHQTLHPLTVYRMALTQPPARHLATAVEGRAQTPDLLIQRRRECLLGRWLRGRTASLKGFGEVLDCLLFPGADLDWMNLILTGQLAGGLHPFDRIKGNFGLEFRGVELAFVKHG